MDIESWFGSELQILTEIRPNVDLQLVQEIHRFWCLLFQSVNVQILTDFDNFWPVVTPFHNFLGFHMLLRPTYCHSDEEFVRNSPLLNTLKNNIPDHIPTDTWIWMGKFRDHLHDFRRKPHNFRYRSVLSAVQKVTFWLSDGVGVNRSRKISIYPCIGYEKNKEIKKSSSENDNTMIESTFWSTEVNFWPISANAGSLRVSDAVLVHLQWSQTESGVKKPSPSSISCLKTDREHSFLRYQKGPQRWKQAQNGI